MHNGDGSRHSIVAQVGDEVLLGLPQAEAVRLLRQTTLAVGTGSLSLQLLRPQRLNCETMVAADGGRCSFLALPRTGEDAGMVLQATV